ncbi:MAG: hypothetical protein ACI83B_001832 [Sediminicola sp.]|jgi:hypothetical protein
MISWEDIEKIKPYYKKYMGLPVVVSSLSLYFLTIYAYAQYSPAGLDTELHFSLFIFWLIVFSFIRIIVKALADRKGKENAQD